jgi:hypothetical protein
MFSPERPVIDQEGQRAEQGSDTAIGYSSSLQGETDLALRSWFKRVKPE